MALATVDAPTDRAHRQRLRARARLRAGAPGRGAHAQRFGRFGERVAARWYLSAGYDVLARNWRCREGELDLVVATGPVVVFVEVKARSSGRFGTGAEAVDHRKQRRVRAVASRWLAANGGRYAEVRFDVVDVDRNGRLQLFQDCF